MKKLLVVVDMQKDFVAGALGSEEAKKIVPEVLKSIQEAKNEGIEVVYTLDTHEADYLNTQEGKKLPVKHCIKGTAGWELDDEIGKALLGAKAFEKPTFGCVDLGKYVLKNGYDDIALVGLCTDICVISNAMLIKAFSPEATVRVKASACAGVSEESHNNALEAMKVCQIEVL